jgi:AraC-like DNA-binding protein
VQVLDSALVPPRDRLDMVVESMASAARATAFTPSGPEGRVRLTMTAWELGAVDVFDAECSAHTLRRGARATSDYEPPSLILTYGLRGAGTHSHLGRDLPVGPSQLWATDLTAPYVHRIEDTRTITAKVAIATLGIPHDLLRQTLVHIGESPLAPLFVNHLTETRRVAHLLDQPASAALGTATLSLARALVASITDDDRLGREALEDTLLLRVQAFVRRHLGDPALDAASIAFAHHVSVRHLYKVCARAELRLEQWIIRERLARAADELARTAPARGTITAVARRWGFTSPSHFTTRFRAAYAVTPREWQALHHR